MAQTYTIDRRAERITLPPPPTCGAARPAWFDSLAEALEIDLLGQRLLLRDLGLNPAEVEAQMAHGYRQWITAWVGGVVDRFAAEIIWAAS